MSSEDQPRWAILGSVPPTVTPRCATIAQPKKPVCTELQVPHRMQELIDAAYPMVQVICMAEVSLPTSAATDFAVIYLQVIYKTPVKTNLRTFPGLLRT